MLNFYTSLYIIASGLEEELVDQEVQRLQPVPGNLTELYFVLNQIALYCTIHQGILSVIEINTSTKHPALMYT